jgi:hypothetical protein
MRDEKKDEAADQHETRRGLLKKLIDHYSSTPITEELSEIAPGSDSSSTPGPTVRRSCLTTSERIFLEQLVQEGDSESIEAASNRLSDLFPPEDLVDHVKEEKEEEEEEEGKTVRVRRDSLLQQELFRLHETQKVHPSHVLQRLSLVHKNSILSDDSGWEYPQDGDQYTEDNLSAVSADCAEPSNNGASNGGEWSLKDLASWVAGGVGVEVTEENGILTKSNSVKGPFKILGTTADDVFCHPHVLSPPLMESLLAFLPESLSNSNFYLKYSLIRDGASLWSLLRNVRASTNCFLAVETVDGHVFGAFTSQPWRVSQGWYGAKDSFLFKMRHSRLENAPSILQKVSNESEIQVFPYRSSNAALQHCSKSGIMMGQGELLPVTIEGGDHLGYAIYLDPSLEHGTTSTSETFGNPCLVALDKRGSTFEVSNIEVWTLTSHTTVAEAEKSELSTMFLEGGQKKKLGLIDIIVGGTV